MKVAAVGRTKILLETMRAVADSDHRLKLVVTTAPADFYEVGTEEFEEVAADIGCEFVSTDSLSNRTEKFAGLDVAVSVNWPTLIPREVLDVFGEGIINYHAGDLPRYRGNAAMNWAILRGEPSIVHTLHRMSAELDAGGILNQSSMPLDDGTYLSDVYEYAERRVPPLFIETLDGLEDGTLTPRPQSRDPSDALRCYPRRPEDSAIDWGRSAEYLVRLVRASSEPLFGAHTRFEGERLIVWRARTEFPEFDWVGTPGQVASRRPDAGEVAVLTGDGFLVLEEVETESGGREPPTEVITSNRDRLGDSPHPVL